MVVCGPIVWWRADQQYEHNELHKHLTTHKTSGPGFSFSDFKTAKLTQHNAAQTNPDPPIQFKRNCMCLHKQPLLIPWTPEPHSLPESTKNRCENNGLTAQHQYLSIGDTLTC